MKKEVLPRTRATANAFRRHTHRLRVTTLDLVKFCYVNVSCPIPRFVFAYVSRVPTSVEDLKNPAITRQLVLIDRYLANNGRAKGMLFPAMLTYRKRAFSDHPTFEKAVAYAHDIDAPLLVGDLDDLLSRIPPDRFVVCADRLRDLKIEVIDARTGNSLRSFSGKKWAQLCGMSIARKRSGLVISAGRRNGRKPNNTGGRNQVNGAISNRRRAERLAERIKPVVEEMKATLPPDRELSPSVLMHRLNELGIKGPNSDTWNRMSAARYLKALRQIETPSED